MCSAINRRGSITDDLVASMPSDLPDLKEATDHMSPLKLPTQICLYPAESKIRVGWEVTSFPRLPVKEEHAAPNC